MKKYVTISTIIIAVSCLSFYPKVTPNQNHIQAQDRKPKDEAGPFVKMPADFKANTKRLVSVEIVADGNDLKWAVIGTDVDSFREFSEPGTIRLRLLAYTDCEATVIAYCCRDNKTSPPGLCKITFGTPAPPVPIVVPKISLSIVPNTIRPGEKAKLSWTSMDATSLMCNPDISLNPIPLSGSVDISPTSSTTYTIVATGPGGSANSSATITISDVHPPSPAPIPLEGFRVIIIHETDLKTGEAIASRPQQIVMFGDQVASFLNSKCVKDANGKQPEWRVWDQHINTTGAASHWQNVMKRPRTKLPWIVISNGKTGFEGPLPENLEETMKLLQKYAPN